MENENAETPATVVSRPEFFYKYQMGTPLQIATLRRRKIWYSVPGSLNDPYDCHLDIRVDKAVQWHEAIIQFMRTPSGRIIGSSFAVCKSWAPDQEAEIRAHYEAEVQQMKELIARTGIFCLSTNPLIDKMWSDFANGARGFCIEYPGKPFFDPNHQQDAANPVDYTEDYPDVDYGVLVREPFPIRMQKLFGYKARNYALEREWRCVIPKGDSEESSPDISAIIFGARSEAGMIDTVKEIFSTDSSPPAFRRIRRMPQSYDLEMVPI